MTLTGLTPAPVPLSGGPQPMHTSAATEMPAPQVVQATQDARDTGTSGDKGSDQHASAPPSIMQMKIDAMLREQAEELESTQTDTGRPPEPAEAMPLAAPA